jgi:hypothetical protein
LSKLPEIYKLLVSGIELSRYGWKMTPEEVLTSVTDGINKRNPDTLMTLYEPVACFALQPGQLSDSLEGRKSLRSFIDLNGIMDLNV